MEIVTFQGVEKDALKKIIAESGLTSLIANSMGVDRFTEAAMQLIQQPGIATCTQESVLGGMLKAAIFNFRISPELGQCWLVPRTVNIGTKDAKQYIKVATFQIGYKGWMELAFRSGEIESFDAGIVHEKDTFAFEKGTSAFLKHIPTDLPNKGAKKWAYAYAIMRSGRIAFSVVPIEEVEKHRKMSDNQVTYQGGQKVAANDPVGIWAAHYDQMAKRIPMRYLCTLQLPKSDDVLQAAQVDGSVTNLSNGYAETISINDVENMAVTEIHEDYINEAQGCKTKAQLREVYQNRKADFSGEMLEAYVSFITNLAKTLPE